MANDLSPGNDLLITPQDLAEVFMLKHGGPERVGPAPRRRLRFGYYTPVDHYEALVNKCVSGETAWVDVGAGRTMFPYNAPLAEILAKRARLIVGVDPSDNLDDNPFLHERAKCSIEEYQTDHLFDLVTVRMVVEHIKHPAELVQALHRLLRPGGRVIVLTVNLWSPLTMAARLLPHRLHYPITRFFWGRRESDTFPTFYRMNTRRQLGNLFAERGFKEVHFSYLGAADTFRHFRLFYYLELSAWRAFRRLGLRYPESNLLSVYEKDVEASSYPEVCYGETFDG